MKDPFYLSAMSKPQRDWTPEECAAVAAEQEALRWLAMKQEGLFGAALSPPSKKEGEG